MVITTKYGKIQGVEKYAFTEYRGIPYAKPPVGNLRWKKPVPLESWEGIYQANSYRNRCAATETPLEPPYDRDFYDDPMYDTPQSEDCLYLHMWVPKTAAKEKCPVALWVHGGAYLGGFSTEKEFGGEAFCREGVILVSVEYRCNIFGFLAHPWLSAESEEGISGNYGLYDVLAALTWVYENIDAFGGDHNNITVFGQSAGAMLVQALISSELSGQMISKAILQSGGSYAKGMLRDITLDEEERYGERFAELLGAKSLEELRAVSTEDLVASLPKYLAEMLPSCGLFFLAPVIDHKILEDGYYSLVDRGRLKNIPIMLGSTKNDITVPAEMGEGKYGAPLYQGIEEFGRKMNQLSRKSTYIYYFSRDLPGDTYGAWHSSELWYMFGTMNRCWRPWEDHDWKLSNDMITYWSTFMRCGNPNRDGLKAWKPYSAETPFIMELR